MSLLQTERRIYTVSDITRNIRFCLEEKFSDIWIEGEISNFKWHTSGHMYFALKDEEAQIQCVMFRSENAKLDFEPEDGLSVLCGGRVSVYPVRGQYQLYVERVEPKGLGSLQLRFQQLKEKLAKEGLFDEAFKKPIPYLPRCIGLVTSIDGAALRDILNVLHRRFSNAHVLVYPVAVQGAGAAAQIAGAIRDFNTLKKADVLIVGRGGGSLEDLWAFNEEAVARAIFESRIPVVSAVGHEVDFTIADFTADLRAATPSAAAELVLPRREDLLLAVDDLRKSARLALRTRLQNARDQLQPLLKARALKDPLAYFEIQVQRLDELRRGLRNSFRTLLGFKEEAAASLVGKLEALGPLATLKRGFSVSLKLPGESVVTSAGQVRKGDRIKTKLANGYLISQVKESAG